MSITKKEIVLVNLQKLQDEFTLELGNKVNNQWVRTENHFEKYGVLIEINNELKHLVIVEGLEDNGVNNAITVNSHWIFDGFVWGKKSNQRLVKENENVKRFIEGQGFNIYTSSWKYLKLVNNQPVYLDSELNKNEIWVFGNEILKEIFQEDGSSFEPKQYESYEPKQYEKLGLQPNVFDAYSFNEKIIRPMQLNDIINRFPNVGEELTF